MMRPTSSYLRAAAEAAPRRAVITGVGVVGPAGTDGSVSLPHRRLERYLSRSSRAGVAAMLAALHDAGGTAAYQSRRRGISVVTRDVLPAPASWDALLQIRHASTGDLVPDLTPLDVIRNHRNTGLGVFAHLGPCEGPVLSMYDEWCGSTRAIGEAFRCIQDGDADTMITGGFDAPRVLDGTHFPVPGFPMPGGAGQADGGEDIAGARAVILILEERSPALARNAHVHAEIVGYSALSGAWSGGRHAFALQAAADTVVAALDEARLAPDQVEAIVLDGTWLAASRDDLGTALARIFPARTPRLLLPERAFAHGMNVADLMELPSALLAGLDVIRASPPSQSVPHDPDAPGTSRRAVVVAVAGSDGTAATLVLCPGRRERV